MFRFGTLGLSKDLPVEFMARPLQSWARPWRQLPFPKRTQSKRCRYSFLRMSSDLMRIGSWGNSESGWYEYRPWYVLLVDLGELVRSLRVHFQALDELPLPMHSLAVILVAMVLGPVLTLVNPVPANAFGPPIRIERMCCNSNCHTCSGHCGCDQVQILQSLCGCDQASLDHFALASDLVYANSRLQTYSYPFRTCYALAAHGGKRDGEEQYFN